MRPRQLLLLTVFGLLVSPTAFAATITVPNPLYNNPPPSQDDAWDLAQETKSRIGPAKDGVVVAVNAARSDLAPQLAACQNANIDGCAKRPRIDGGAFAAAVRSNVEYPTKPITDNVTTTSGSTQLWIQAAIATKIAETNALITMTGNLSAYALSGVLEIVAAASGLSCIEADDGLCASDDVVAAEIAFLTREAEGVAACLTSDEC